MDTSTLDADIKAYLQGVADDLSYADAAVALGFARRSYHSVRALYETYGVVPPARKNQHVAASTHCPEPVERVVRRPTSPAQRSTFGTARTLVCSDLHAPYHDPLAIGIVLAMIEDLRPETAVIAGDLVDFYALSRYDKDPSRALALTDERDATSAVLAGFREAAGDDARIILVEGNHEARLRAFLRSRAPELSYLPELSLSSFLGLERHGIEFVPMRGRSAYVDLRGIKIGHFDRVYKHSAYTAKMLLDDYSCDILQGHTHRLGLHYRTRPGGVLVAGELGCLCDLRPEYMTDPNWQQGVTIITHDAGTNIIQQVPIIDHKAVFNDVLYEARR